jgi:hypothetical protein
MLMLSVGIVELTRARRAPEAKKQPKSGKIQLPLEVIGVALVMAIGS